MRTEDHLPSGECKEGITIGLQGRLPCTSCAKKDNSIYKVYFTAITHSLKLATRSHRQGTARPPSPSLLGAWEGSAAALHCTSIHFASLHSTETPTAWRFTRDASVLRGLDREAFPWRIERKETVFEKSVCGVHCSTIYHLRYAISHWR